MEKRVKLFQEKNCDVLEIEVNDFLKLTRGKLHDVKYCFQEGITEAFHVAMLIYTDED